MPSGPSDARVGRGNNTVDAVAALLLSALLVVTYSGTQSATIYATADAGHYLADADALLGQGVRDLRHLPLFPALVAGTNVLFDDRATIVVAALALVSVMFVSFYLAVRGRFGHSLGEPIGAVIFAGSTTTAEALGWYGGAMLLGLGLLPLASRVVDDALALGSRRRLTLAAVFCAATAYTHPLPLALLAIACTGSVVMLVFDRRRGGGSTWAQAVAGRAAVIGLATGASLIPVWAFVGALQSPVDLTWSPEQLELIWNWAFRENPMLWIGLLLLGLVAAASCVASGHQSRRVVTVAVVLAALAVATTVFIAGDRSYTTRSLYILAFPAALGATWLLSMLERRPADGPRQAAIAAAAGATLCALVLVGFGQHLSVSVPYYNQATPDEFDGIRHLRDVDADTVLVTPRGGDRNAGTLFGWLIEGFAEQRAVGPGRPYIFLLDSARTESLDSERLLAGSEVLEVGSVRLGIERSSHVVTFQVRIKDDWVPAWTLRIPYRAGEPPGTIVTDPGSQRLVVDPNDALTLSVRTDAAEVQVEVEWDAARSGVHLSPSYFLPTRASDRRGVQRVEQTTPEGPLLTMLDGPHARLEREDAPDRSWRYASAATTGRRQLTLTFSGADPSQGGPQAYDAETLASDLGISHVFAWRESEEAGRLATRPCLRRSFANRSVIIYEVEEELDGC